MKIPFGKTKNGTEIYKYVLKNEDAELTLMTFGAAIVSLRVYGTDIVGGYDSIDDYLADDSHQGATIGRVANRVGGGAFTMDGITYRLPKNDGENCLHGGCGFDRRVWNVSELTENKITFTYTSADGEEGFPAVLDVSVSYTLTGTELKIDYKAIPHGKTPIALTNHSYFNLNGFGGDILAHTVEIFADRYTEVDGALIPSGNRPTVADTVFDLRKPTRIGKHVGEEFEGYDHNFILSPTEFEEFEGKKLGLAARVSGEKIRLSVFTDQPGIQFYIGNFLGGEPNFKGGVKRIKHGAFCLETQTEPNCINNGEAIYDPTQVYTHTTVYRTELSI